MTETDARETVARLRHLRTSPTKVRPVLQLITGQDVFSARDTLRLSDRAVSHDVAKLLNSAIANAEHNDNIPEDELYVAKAFADEGPTLKRWRPRARGRGTRIRKRTTHLTIVVARLDDERLEERRRAEAAGGGRGPRRVGRRRPAAAPVEEHDHDHDHDDEAEAAPAKKATKSTKKTTKKTAKKATKKATKKAEPAKKSTTKKSTTKKSTAKKTAKKATKKPASDAGDGEQD
jgi:large subunit ribosomal protein L22